MTYKSEDRKILNKLMPPLHGRELYTILVAARENIRHQIASGKKSILEQSGLEQPGWRSGLFETLTKYTEGYATVARWIVVVREFEEDKYLEHFGKILELNPRWIEEHKITPAEEFKSNFHLACCPRCDVPAWGQPCIYCDFRPMRDADWEMDKAMWHVGFETYIGRLKLYDNFTAFYFSSYMRSVAYGNTYAYKQYVQDLIAKAADMECPSPHEIWAATKFYREVT